VVNGAATIWPLRLPALAVALPGDQISAIPPAPSTSSTVSDSASSLMEASQVRLSKRMPVRADLATSRGRIQNAVLTSVNGSSSNQNARAAAPAVRLPQEYASTGGPGGGVIPSG
jgi:hypothetical protein